jgi:hypothetical protein
MTRPREILFVHLPMGLMILFAFLAMWQTAAERQREEARPAIELDRPSATGDAR